MTRREIVEEYERAGVQLKEAYAKQLAAYEVDREAEIRLDLAQSEWRNKKDSAGERWISGRDVKERDAEVFLLTMKEREKAFEADVALKNASAELDLAKRGYDKLGHLIRLFDGNSRDEI